MVISVLMAIATIVRLFSKQWVVFSISVLVKKLELALLMMISNQEPKKRKTDELQKDCI